MTREEIQEIVKAVANYSIININWRKDLEKTTDRVIDFIGKELVITTSESK